MTTCRCQTTGHDADCSLRLGAAFAPTPYTPAELGYLKIIEDLRRDLTTMGAMALESQKWRDEKIAGLELQLQEARKILQNVKKVAEEGEWWMVSPDKGGIDVDEINKFLGPAE